MHDLKQHIHMQMHKPGNNLDWLISNSPNNILDITNKDFLSDHCIIEWQFQISLKVREKQKNQEETSAKLMKKKFNHDLNMNLETDAGNTLQQNYNNYMDAIKKTMDKIAPLIPRLKQKKTTILVQQRFSKAQNPMKNGLRKGGSNQKNMKTSWNTSASTQYIRSTYIMPRKHIYCTN